MMRSYQNRKPPVPQESVQARLVKRLKVPLGVSGGRLSIKDRVSLLCPLLAPPGCAAFLLESCRPETG